MKEKIAFFINSDTKDRKTIGEKLMETATEHGFSCLEIQTCSNQKFSGKLAFIAAVGGDGTILKAVPHALKHDAAILGINAGRIGFLGEIAPDNFVEALSMYKQGLLIEDRRMMLECEVNGVRATVCLNEILLYKKAFSGVAHINLFVNGADAGTVYCDGMIIGTPTGSTGYSISAGGPIIAPGLDAFVITPVCSHSLLAKPIVASRDTVVTLSVRRECCLYADGRVIMDVSGNDMLSVSRAKEEARFLRIGERNLFDLVREKLS